MTTATNHFSPSHMTMRATAKEWKPAGERERAAPLSGPPPPPKPAVNVSTSSATGASGGGGGGGGAKQISLTGGPAKVVSLGTPGTAPTNNAVLAATGGAKQVSLAPAKVVNLSAPTTTPPSEGTAQNTISKPPAKVVALGASPAPAPMAAATDSRTTETSATTPPPAAEPSSTVSKPTPAPRASPPPASGNAAPTTTTTSSNQEEGEEDAASEVAVQEADPREHLNVVFIGHVDAGKSTLCGSILYAMEVVDKRTIEKYEKEAKERNRESWFLAYIMDTNEEERQKGKTVEVGKANFETEKKRVTILDAPGHKNYVPAMISGASHADVGVLVISARKGEFESGFEKGGQTKEHAMLAFTLGMRKLVVVINKMDDPSVNWSRERYDEIEGKIAPFLKSCGFKVKKDVYFMPIAALSGAGVKRRVDLVKECPWAVEYNEGKSLIEVIEGVNIEERNNTEKELRLSVLASYVDRGVWTMGKIEKGVLKVGMTVCVSPTALTATISEILIDEVSVRSAKCGENVVVKLKSPDITSETDVQKGFVLSERRIGSKQFTATIRLLELLETHPVFTAGYSAVLHAHTIAEECVVEKILWKHDAEGKPIKEQYKVALSGDTVTVRIRCPQAVAVDTYEDCPQLGRITLRDQGKSIAIGKVKKLEE